MDYIDAYLAVPQELKELCQWVLWREETRDGKLTKIPYQTNGQKAKSNVSSTWTDYRTAWYAHQKQRIQTNGIGFMFSPNDPYCGIDLDDCFYKDKSLKPWAKPIVDRIKTVGYGEVSPSGYGIKFWTRAILPVDTKHKVYLTNEGIVCLQGENNAGAIETYDKTRYFTVTGQGKYAISGGQEVINWLYDKYLKPQSKKSQSKKRNNNQPHTSLNLSSQQVIEKIRQSRQCHKFDALMQGDTKGYGSDSEADLALCSVIAFWTQEPTTIDAIFRQSALMRTKWDEKHRSDGATYGQMTIEKATVNRTQTYTPQKRQYTGQSRAYIARQLNRYFGRQR